jgi:hypothetical protein
MRANQFLESISIDDNFDIEFDDFVIESSVVGFTEDGVIIEGDDKALALLGVSGALLESTKLEENPLLATLARAALSGAAAEFGAKAGTALANKIFGSDEEDIAEAEYQGRKVPLGKPMRGDVKKFKVYVKNPKGNVVKVNFGDPNMRIKKSNPARRKSFRARHNCANPGPRHKARYWSCRKW